MSKEFPDDTPVTATVLGYIYSHGEGDEYAYVDLPNTGVDPVWIPVKNLTVRPPDEPENTYAVIRVEHHPNDAYNGLWMRYPGHDAHPWVPVVFEWAANSAEYSDFAEDGARITVVSPGQPESWPETNWDD